MSFTLNILDSKIYHLKFDDSTTLYRYMVRMEEFYESPEFANKVFELADYIKWYQKEYGSWSYYNDWAGFNIPGNKVKEFKDKFQKLRGCEKENLSRLPDYGKYYLIATSSDNDQEIIEHEAAHTLFFLNENYKKQMTELVNKHKHKCDELSSWILKSYSENVLIDEIQAYLSTAKEEWFQKKSINIDPGLLSIFSQKHKELAKK